MKTFETGHLTEEQTEGAVLDQEIKQGIEASEAGDKVGAEAIFRRIVAEHPDTLEAWIWLGWTSSSLDSSEDAFTRASALDPHNEEAKLGLRWVTSQRAPSKALTPAELLVNAETQPVVEPAHEPASLLGENWTLEDAMRRAVSASRAGDKHNAYSMFRQVADRCPDMPTAWVWCGGTSPTLEDAEAAFKRAYQIDPNNEEAALGLRWVSLRRQVERQSAQGNTDFTSSATYPQSTRTIANLTGNTTFPPIMHEQVEQDEDVAADVATETVDEGKPAKKLSAFARFLKRLNIPLPFMVLALAVVIVWVMLVVMYLADAAH